MCAFTSPGRGSLANLHYSALLLTWQKCCSCCCSLIWGTTCHLPSGHLFPVFRHFWNIYVAEKVGRSFVSRKPWWTEAYKSKDVNSRQRPSFFLWRQLHKIAEVKLLEMWINEVFVSLTRGYSGLASQPGASGALTLLLGEKNHSFMSQSFFHLYVDLCITLLVSHRKMSD